MLMKTVQIELVAIFRIRGTVYRFLALLALTLSSPLHPIKSDQDTAGTRLHQQELCQLHINQRQHKRRNLNCFYLLLNKKIAF